MKFLRTLESTVLAFKKPLRQEMRYTHLSYLENTLKIARIYNHVCWFVLILGSWNGFRTDANCVGKFGN